MLSDQSPIVDSLDMTDERDRGTLRRSVGGGHHKRWGGITDEKKARYSQALDVALRMALEKQDHRNIRGCVETLAKLEAQNQADEHLAEKYERIDTGKGTEANAILDGRDMAQRLLQNPDALRKAIEASEHLRDAT